MVVLPQAFILHCPRELFFYSGKPVAIKVASLVSLSSGQAEILAVSILNEIEMSKRLSQASKHVVRMFDFDFHRHSGLAFLVMELGEKDLEKALQDQGRLGRAERKHVWKQLVDIAVILNHENIVGKPRSIVDLQSSSSSSSSLL